MITKNIAWNSGEGNITVTYNGKGNGSITITTDNNILHSDRSLVIGVLTTDGLISNDLTIMQVAKPYIDLSTAVVTAATLTYNGGALTPTVTVMLDGDEVPSTQYDVEYSNNTNAGTATITVTGKIDYTGTATGTFIINKANPVYTAPTATSPIYNGTGLNLLNVGSTAHGTILYSSNGTSWGTGIPQGTNASDYTSYWRLIGDSNHNSVSSTSITTTISKVTPTVVAPTPNTLTYNELYLELVTAGSTDWGTLKYSLDNSTWSTDVPTAINYGTYTVYYKVDGDSNINSIASTSIEASIAEKRVTTPTITLDVSSYTYNGNQCTPTPTVKDGSTVIPPSEYTVSYSNNINAGTATVTISDNVGGNYYIIGSTTFTINKVTPTVTAPTAKTLTYTGNSQVLANAGSTNWGTLLYSSDNSTWSTTIPSGTNAGTSYKVYYRVVGDSNINDVASTYITCAIGKAAPTYTAPTAKTLTYNGSALGLLNAGSTSHGTIQYSSDNSTWSTSIPTGTSATSYNTYWRLVGDTNHLDIGSTLIVVSISKVTPSITAPTAKSLTYTGSAQALINAGSVDFGVLYYSLDNSAWSTSVPTGTTATSYTVYYKVVGDSNVNDVPSQSVACSIGKASLSASVSMDGWTYGGTASNPSVSGNSGGGGITYNYKVNGAADSTYTATKPNNAGTYVVRAQIAETTNYYGATVTNTFTIAQATGSATVTGVTTTYNRGAQNLLTVSGNTGTMHYRIGTSGSWTTTIPSATNAGSTTIYFYMDASTNYTARGSASSPWSYITGTINKATPVLSTSPTYVSAWTYDGSAHNLLSGGSMQHSSSDSTAVAGSFAYDQGTNAGTYANKKWYFTPTDTTNYNSTNGVVSGSVTVAKANAHTAPVANTTTYTGNAIALVVNGSANNKGTLEYSTNNSSWSTTVPTQYTAGTYTTYWRFTPTDTTNYNTVGSTSISTTIYKAAGSISYATTSVSKTYGNSAFTNALTKSGDGSVTYTSSNTSVATVNSSGQVTIVGAGSATITATVTDGTNYSYATKTASYSLSVAKAAGSVTTAPVNNNYVYNGNSRNVASAGSGTGTMYYKLSGGSWSTSMPKMTSAGSDTLYYYAAESTNYTQSNTGSITVSVQKADQPAPIPYGATTTYPTTATATASGGGGVGSLEWESSESQSSVGSHTTRARWTGNSNYNASPWSDYVTVQMNKAAGSVSIYGNSLTYNGSAQALATASWPTGTMHYSTDYSTWSTSIPTSVNAGSWTIYWYMDASTNYEGIGSASSRYVVATIAKADQSAPTAYGDTTTYPTTATATASGGGGVGTIEWSNGNTQTSVGSKTTYARWSGNSNYNPSAWSNGVTLAMNKAAGSVSISGRSLSYNGGSQSLVSVSGATGTMHYSTDYSNWSTDIPSATNAGSYTVYWYMDESTNYEGISASTSRYVSSSIAKIAAPITTEPIARTGLVYDGTALQLCTNGAASIAGTWNYPTSINAASTIQGTVYFIPTDTTNYNQYSKLITTSISKAGRTLSFAVDYAVLDTSSNATYTATPSAGSGDGAITYSISSTTYATINSSSGKVTAKTSDGRATVYAIIAEGTNYLAASASYTLCVFATTHNFSYTGSVQEVTLPPGSYKLQCWGAQGGSNTANSSYGITSLDGGKGGYSEGVLTTYQDRTVYVFVGGQGSSSGNGGWNGGGGSSGSASYTLSEGWGTSTFGCGGGGTDIALTTSSMSYSSRRTNRNSASLLSRIIVAGGGSGGAMGYKETYTSSTETLYMSGLEQGSMDSSGNSQWEIDSASRVRLTDMFPVVPGKSCINCTINTNLVDRVGMIYYYPNGTPYSDKGWKDPATQWDAPGKWYVGADAYAGYVRLYFRGTQNITPSQVSSGITAYCETTVESTITETDCHEGWPGGGTTGGAYRSGEQATLTSAGGTDGNPNFGNGATQNTTNYRFVAGAGGGGWYGGGTTLSDLSLYGVQCSGGGSGWVNTSSSTSNRPSGYTGIQLDSGTTTKGDSRFVSPSGGYEYGHYGNGYARITRL